jgi:hypothetical protein
MIADLCSELWRRNCNAALQIFNSEVDNAGFDLVLKLNSAIRYVQIKQSHDLKVPAYSSTRVSFSKLNGSCIALISYNREDLTISGYRFYGEYPHEPMQTIDEFKPTKSPGRRNAKGERHVRSHYRNVPLNRFKICANCRQLLELLFPPYLSKNEEEGDPILALEGTWPSGGQDADEYVKGLRDGWE